MRKQTVIRTSPLHKNNNNDKCKPQKSFDYYHYQIQQQQQRRATVKCCFFFVLILVVALTGIQRSEIIMLIPSSDLCNNNNHYSNTSNYISCNNNIIRRKTVVVSTSSSSSSNLKNIPQQEQQDEALDEESLTESIPLSENTVSSSFIANNTIPSSSSSASNDTATTTENNRHHEDTNIQCIDIASLKTCNGTIVNLHCQHTYLVNTNIGDSINNNKSVRTTTIDAESFWEDEVCSILVRNQYDKQNTTSVTIPTYVQGIVQPPVCIQDYTSNACILVTITIDRSSTNKSNEILSIEQQQQQNAVVRFVESTEKEIIKTYVLKQRKFVKESIRRIRLKRIDFPLYYFRTNDYANTITEWYRDTNFGNMVWRYGASRMLNPLTTEIVHDKWNISNIPDDDNDNDDNNDGSIDNKNYKNQKVDALVLASANTFRISKKPMYQQLTEQKIEYIERLNVPTIVLGIGVQVHFDSLVVPETNSTATVSTSVQRRDQLTMTDLKLPHPFQINYLQAISDHQSRPAIGVRGDMTNTVCKNSGINNCISTGCPSLTISRDLNLGRTLHNNWLRTIQKLSTAAAATTTNHNSNTNKTTRTTLRIALTSPSPGKFAEVLIALRCIATILDNNINSNNEILLSIVTQDKGDSRRINDYIEKKYKKLINPKSKLLTATIIYKEYFNVESWMAFAKKHDLCIAFRIHGSMTFISSGIPTILMPTDFRLMELVMSMHIPYIPPDIVLRILQQQKEQQQSKNINIGTTTQATLRRINNNDTESFYPIVPSSNYNNNNNNILLKKLMNRAQQTNFTNFEINRRTKIRLWKTILDVANLEMDPSLLKIIQTPL